MTTPASILRTENLTMRFGGLTAVGNFSIDVPQGKIVGLIGPNGAGKTTVFNMITGFYRPTEGRIFFDGQDITGFQPHMVCRSGISRTFQNIRLFTNETVLENVMIGCHVRRKSKWWMAPLGLPSFRAEEEAIREKSMDLLKSVGLEDFADEPSASLSYGAQRRLEIARALATDPKFLLLDEPAAGMNPQESQELMSFIRNIQKRFNLTILLIEHDMKVVMGVCEYIWVLDYGVKIAEGNPDAIQSDQKVIVAYLGEEYVKYVEN
ncbi:MAG TPA: ABC transporter ATP-binding protein [Synergistales bacterium]|nr:ABC transporter ATP-binding protein [Synergistaceae bacterium]HOO86864.1 ABC transporter ATP-binding protein [Synergistales bacterium]HRV97414.1 ABC transporter ATP-binding protein [Aminobacteriaceae bacterium]MDD3915791.1 ABC transporter ATP-binding protein [Synergistaceae bacterium]NLD97651.1 ABC transporter ATP-binding protein [Synergistaceae bacterium]